MGSLPYKRPRFGPPPDLIVVSDSEASSTDESESGEVSDEKHYTCRVCLDPNLAAKYICPRCLMRSCSLACSQAHKTKYNCNGVRERTKYKAKGNMTSEDLKSDLSVLVDASVAIETASRIDSSIALRSFAGRPGADQSSPGQNLSRALRDVIVKELGVIFRQSPTCSARRHRNTTTYKKKKLKWRVEWQIYIGSTTEAGSGRSEVGTPINLAVKGHLGTCDLKLAVSHALKSLNLDVSNDQFLCLLQDESVPSNQRGFVLLDLERPINENLRGLVVIDFPTFYLVDKSLIGVKDVTSSYDFAVESLPHWAQIASESRLEHVYSFLNKP